MSMGLHSFKDNLYLFMFICFIFWLHCILVKCMQDLHCMPWSPLQLWFMGSVFCSTWASVVGVRDYSCPVGMGSLVPGSGIEPRPLSGLEGRILNHCTSREVRKLYLYIYLFFILAVLQFRDLVPPTRIEPIPAVKHQVLSTEPPGNSQNVGFNSQHRWKGCILP